MTLEEIRLQIDQVDQEMKQLFIRRMHLADQVAQVKAKNEDAIYKPDRESAILRRQSADVDEKLQMEYRALLRRIMEVSRKYQYGRTLQLRDCFPYEIKTAAPQISSLGVLRGEYYLTDASFGVLEPTDAAIVPFLSFDEMGRSIRAGAPDAGLGIIEHIGSGVCDELNSALLRHQLCINGCQVLEDGEEKQKVVTFSRDLTVREEDNRLKLVFIAPNRSGSLGSILSMIADYGVNLTEIHSIPFREGKDWNYRFFLELELNLLREDARALIFQLSSETAWMQLLGSYRCVGDFIQ